jgi:hypothetical protein
VLFGDAGMGGAIGITWTGAVGATGTSVGEGAGAGAVGLDGGATTDCVWLYELFPGFGSLTPCGALAAPVTLTLLPTAPVTVAKKSN